MSQITVNYAGMAAGHSALINSWNRIEALLRELDASVVATGSMRAETLNAYLALKARWDAAAADRQLALKGLANVVDGARRHYQELDRRVATMFLG